jgi:hypothetical protein
MPKGLRKFTFSFEDSHLTHFGGMVLFHQFCRKMDIKRFLQNHISWQRRDSIYCCADLVMTIIVSIVAGMERFSDTRILPYNGYVKSILGLERFPDASTIRKFLKSLMSQEVEGIARMHDVLRRKVWVKNAASSLILDLDSTVLPLFGSNIQEAHVGYNPKFWGRPSYHPLLCFEGHSRDTWHGILRPGNTHAITGMGDFWKICLGKIPKYLYRLRVRADAGFYDHEFIESLDDQNIGYAIVAKMSRPVQAKVQSLRYKTFRKGGWQAAEFAYQPHNWQRPHQFFVVRRPKEIEQDNAQITLWQDRVYSYQTFVSNLSMPAQSVWHFYRKRARAELDIRELKESFPLGKIASNNFLANQAHFHLILLSYDLVNWFKHLCLPQRWQNATLKTIRTDILVVPARLVHSGGRNQLNLPLKYPYQKEFQETLQKINRLKIT